MRGMRRRGAERGLEDGAVGGSAQFWMVGATGVVERRWRCPGSECGVGSFTEQAGWIAPERARLTARAARWATLQVGQGRTISEVAEELGCDWRTVAKEANCGGKP